MEKIEEDKMNEEEFKKAQLLRALRDLEEIVMLEEPKERKSRPKKEKIIRGRK